jgi:hypothetical protein
VKGRTRRGQRHEKTTMPRYLPHDEYTPRELAGDRSCVLRLEHIGVVVDDVEASLAALRPHGAELVGELGNYENSYRLRYGRGPAGIIVELAGKIG